MKYLLALLALTSVLSGQKLLVVDVDDLGKEFVGAHPQSFFNALDQYGRHYDRFYTYPVCSPTRACAHYGVHGTHPDLQSPWLISTSGGFGTQATPVRGNIEPLGQALSSKSIAKIGKWHMSLVNDLTHPNDCGWDHYAGVMGNPLDYYNYSMNVNGTAQPVSGLYLTKCETDLAISAMEAGHDLVWLSYHTIHDPWHVPPAGTYSGPVPTTDYDKAVAMLENLNHELWRLGVQALVNGYHLILFSDNGGKQLTGGQKGSVLESGINTDMWLYGPGVVPGEDNSLVGCYDLYRTIMQFFGIAPSQAQGPESVSFLLTAIGVPGGRDSIFSERYLTNNVTPDPLDPDWIRAVIGHEYKFLIRPNGERLYLLPNEVSNLLNSGITPEEQAAYDFLTAQLLVWTQ